LLAFNLNQVGPWSTLSTPNSKPQRSEIPMAISRNQPLTIDDVARLDPSALASIREAPVNQKYAARFLNLHPKTVLRKAREGSLPAHPVGTDRKRWHFYLSELDQWLRSQVISGSHPRRQPQGDYIG
jgi:excisionase family DNA binding protein